MACVVLSAQVTTVQTRSARVLPVTTALQQQLRQVVDENTHSDAHGWRSLQPVLSRASPQPCRPPPMSCVLRLCICAGSLAPAELARPALATCFKLSLDSVQESCAVGRRQRGRGLICCVSGITSSAQPLGSGCPRLLQAVQTNSHKDGGILAIPAPKLDRPPLQPPEAPDSD